MLAIVYGSTKYYLVDAACCVGAFKRFMRAPCAGRLEGAVGRVTARRSRVKRTRTYGRRKEDKENSSARARDESRKGARVDGREQRWGRA